MKYGAAADVDGGDGQTGYHMPENCRQKERNPCRSVMADGHSGRGPASATAGEDAGRRQTVAAGNGSGGRADEPVGVVEIEIRLDDKMKRVNR